MLLGNYIFYIIFKKFIKKNIYINSAVIGAAIGIKYRLSNSYRAQLMAFGAGSLLFATTNELFAKAVEQYVLHYQHPENFAREGGLPGIFILVLFAMIGALSFVILSKFLDDRGKYIYTYIILY